MANKKLTELVELVTPHDDDYIYVVDVSDTSGDPTGTGKKVRLSNQIAISIPVIAVADAATRELPGTYSSMNPVVVPYIGMRVKESDTGNILRLDNGLDVSDDDNWNFDYVETFDSIVLPEGSRAEVDAKNAGEKPQQIAEPAWITDEDLLQFRKGDGSLVKLGASGEGGGGLVGNSFVAVYGDGTDAVANGTALKAAYATAKALTPNGAALGVKNRAKVLVFPGVYDLGGDPSPDAYDPNLTLDTQYVDIIGIGGSKANRVYGAGMLVYQTANDILLQGLTLEATSIDDSEGGPTAPAAYCPSGSFPLARLIDVACSGATYSHSQGVDFSGTYIDCAGGDNSFGSEGYYTAGNFSGTAIRCKAGVKSFGGGDQEGAFSGEAFNCSAGATSFGYVTFSGKAYNCTSGDFSFGANSSFTGEAYDCVAGSDSFGMSFAGKAHRCRGADRCFGSWIDCSGEAIDCVGGTDSFSAQSSITATARLLRCTAPAFPVPASGGKRTLCIETTTYTVITD